MRAFLAFVVPFFAMAFAAAQTGGGGHQITRDGSFELDKSADKAMPLFTPEGERVWGGANCIESLHRSREVHGHESL